MSKTAKKKAEKMTPDEVRIANRVLRGKEKIYKLNSIEDLDKPLSDLKLCR